jgi:hypothetical protein
VRRSRLIVPLAFATSVLVPGCAGVANLFRGPEIAGDPAQVGLLIVDCQIITNFDDRGFLEVALGDDKADVVGGVVSGSDGREIEGTARYGVLLFDSLAPDTYVLRLIRGRRQLTEKSRKELYDCPGGSWGECPQVIALEYLIHTDDHRRLTFEVEAGAVSYVGRLTFDENHEPPFSQWAPSVLNDSHRHHNPRDVLTIEESPKHEIETLENVVSKHAPGVWTDRIRARLEELSAGTADAARSESGAAPIEPASTPVAIGSARHRRRPEPPVAERACTRCAGPRGALRQPRDDGGVPARRKAQRLKAAGTRVPAHETHNGRDHGPSWKLH